MLREAVRLLSGSGCSPSAALIAAVSDSRAPQTWNRYMGPLRAWSEFAAGHGSPWLPANPMVFAEFLVQSGTGNVGFSQTKARCNAIAALSAVAGVPSPNEHPMVQAVRASALRSKRAKRGSARPIFGEEIPTLAPPDASPPPAPTPQTGPGLSARSLRARSAAAAHMAVLHDGALRYDDLQEAQLGDFLFFPDAVDVSVFGSKTDPRCAGQPAALPREGAGAAALTRNAKYGMKRLLELAPATLADLGTRLAQILGPRGRAGPEALATWPQPVQDLAARLVAAGVPAHGLPPFGRWLFEELRPGDDLTASLGTSEGKRDTSSLI